MKMYVAGEWRDGRNQAEVVNPYTGLGFETVPAADIEDAQLALGAAALGARQMAALPAYRRAEMLERAANIAADRVEQLTETISAEQGKTRNEAQGEASRIASMLRYCAGEALRQQGEVLSMDSAEAGVGRLGFTVPGPCGVVLAITPFNYPALLVCHKIGPAFAAGNAVILKPAETTPLTALLLTEIVLAAGFPEHALQCITGSGARLGPVLSASKTVRKISFTGSVNVGDSIARNAGAKRLTCELGSTAAIVVLDDADTTLAAREIVRSAYANAGQVCISAQRVLVTPGAREGLVDAVLTGIDQIRAGDPAASGTTMGPVITEAEAGRIIGVLQQAERDGGRLLRGGMAEGALVAPALVVDVPSASPIWADELFGPAVAVRETTPERAIADANTSRYGLSMSIFTQDIDRALAYARNVDSGMVHINSGPLFRIDSMPYGGVRDSGFGKEGIRYAMEEMTERKLVIIHPGSHA